jgi:DNA-binding CsgD family transcriptional regulator
LNNVLGAYHSASSIFHTDLNEYWFSKTGQMGMFNFVGDSLKLEKEVRFDLMHASSVDDNQNIWKISEQYYIIGLDNGFAIYDAFSNRSLQNGYNKNIKLVHATSSNARGEIKVLEVKNVSSYEIPFEFRNLIFHFSVPGKLNETYSIEYKLDNDIWVNNGETKIINFNYLKWGKHRLQIKTVDENLQEMAETSYWITILPPWYFMPYALLAYILVIAGLVYLISYIYRQRLKKQKLVYLKKIKAENTRRIIRLKNQYLQDQVYNKSKELVNYTVLLRKKNEVLIRIKEFVNKFIASAENDHRKLTAKIFDIIDQNLTDNNDWKIFSAHFDEAHSNFLKKIKIDHPGLTPNDLRLCAFLKMNLTSKEIASLLNMSFRSVEVKRYRLRKKLDLEHDKNLVEYIMNV